MITSPIIIYEHKLALVPFEDIFIHIEKNFLNDLLLYDLLKDNKIDLRKKDTKKLIYHHLIYNICEEIINIKRKYKVDVCITYNSIYKESDSEICSYIDCNILYDQLIRTIKNIEKTLYITFYHLNENININNLESGEVIDILNLIITKMSRASTGKNVNFSKIRDFVKKFELTFLDEQYFRQINCHHLLI